MSIRNPSQLSGSSSSHARESESKEPFTVPESQQEDYKHCRLRFLAYTADEKVLNHFVSGAILALNKDWGELPPMVNPIFNKFLEDKDSMYKVYVLLVIILASPTFQKEIYDFSDEFPLTSFLAVLNFHFDAMLCGISTSGSLCISGEEERRYRTVRSFVSTMRSIIFTL